MAMNHRRTKGTDGKNMRPDINMIDEEKDASNSNY
jgi:hypothetical protein